MAVSISQVRRGGHARLITLVGHGSGAALARVVNVPVKLVCGIVFASVFHQTKHTLRASMVILKVAVAD